MKLSASVAFALYGALGLSQKTALGFLATVSRLGGDTALSMLAVRDTYSHLALSGKHEIADAVRAVYGGVSRLPFRSRDISNRVRYFAAENFMDDRTVYRRLRAAREIYGRVWECYEKTFAGKKN